MTDTWAARGRTLPLWRQRARFRAELDLIPMTETSKVPGVTLGFWIIKIFAPKVQSL